MHTYINTYTHACKIQTALGRFFPLFSVWVFEGFCLISSLSFSCVSLSLCALQGFTYPHEAGYPIESRQAKYYLMETHYNNLKPDFAQLHARQMADNSGLKIYFTHVLRPNDAGILSIGKYI